MIGFGKNLAVFILFFGLALVEAFQSRNWLKAGIFFALGIMALLADVRQLNNKNITNKYL